MIQKLGIGEPVRRVKLYKSGKTWVAADLLTVAVSGGFLLTKPAAAAVATETAPTATETVGAETPTVTDTTTASSAAPTEMDQSVQQPTSTETDTAENETQQAVTATPQSTTTDGEVTTITPQAVSPSAATAKLATQPDDSEAQVSGTWGTTSWSIDATTGNLAIGAGTAGTNGKRSNTSTGETEATSYFNDEAHDYSDQIKTITLADGFVLNANSAYAFANLTNLTTITGLDRVDTSNVVNLRGLFMEDSNLADVGDLSGWQTGNVVDTAQMFQNTSALTNVGDLGQWDMYANTDLSRMFYSTGLTTVGDLSQWQTDNVTNMAELFYNDMALTSVGQLDQWQTGQVTDMNNMFYNTYDLASVGNLSQWDTRQVTDMNGMFQNMWALTTPGSLANWDTSQVVNLQNLFAGDFSLTTVGDLSQWQTGQVTDMNSMFSGAESLTGLGNLSNWDTSQVVDMSYMFEDTSALTETGDFSHWDTANVTNMENIFSGAGFSKLDLTNWTTSEGTDVIGMLDWMSNLNTIVFGSGWQAPTVNVPNAVLDETQWLGETTKQTFFDTFTGQAADTYRLVTKATVQQPVTTIIQTDQNQVLAQQSGTNTYDVQTDDNGLIVSVDKLAYQDLTDTLPDGYALTQIKVVEQADYQNTVLTVTYDVVHQTGNVVKSSTDATTGVTTILDLANETDQTTATEQAIALLGRILTKEGAQYTVSFKTQVTAQSLLTGNIDQVGSDVITYTVTALPTTASVQYIDQATGQVVARDAIGGTTGETQSYQAQVLQGYRLANNQPAQVTLKFLADNQTLVNIYVVQVIHEIPDESQTQTQLTVHHVDEAGNKLAADTTQSGQVGTVYTIATPTIKGYWLPTDKQALLTGTYAGNQMDLTLTYEKEGVLPDEGQTQTQLTVHYVDEAGNQLAADTTQSGQVGTAYTVATPRIKGYRLATDQQVLLAGTYVGNQMDLTLTYEKEGVVPDEGQTQTQLTVHYVDEAGHQLAADGHQSGQVGTAYTIATPTIKGYWLPTDQQALLTGTYAGNQMDLTLTYEKEGVLPDESQTQTQLTVHYVDEAGHQLADDTNQSGQVGTAYTVATPTIKGYRLATDQQALLTGTYAGNQMDLTLTYEKEGILPDEGQTQTQLTVHYVDEAGHQLADDTTQSGQVGTVYTVTTPTIKGYRLATDQQALLTGTYAGNQMDLTLTYEKEGVLPDEGQTQTQLTVHYVDEAGNQLADDTTQSGQVGTLYTLEVPTIKGYFLPETQQTYLTGMYAGNQMTLTLTYEKEGVVPDENQTQTQLTVHYVDEQGQTIAKTTTQSGKIGTGYTVVAPKIAGYWLPETEQAHLVGKYQGNQMTLTLTYQKVGSVPDEDQTQTQLTVHYVDEQGQTIAVDTQQQGRLGTPFTITAPSIAGYHLVDQHQAITQGTYQGNQMTLTLVYQKDQTTQPAKPTETITPERPTVKPHTNGINKWSCYNGLQRRRKWLLRVTHNHQRLSQAFNNQAPK